MLRGIFVKFSTIVAVTSLCLCLQNVANAGTFTWNGGGADSNLSTPANWTPVAGALGNDDLIFAGSVKTTPTNSATVTYNSLSFASGASPFTLGGSAITVSTGISNLSTSLQTIIAPITLSVGNHVISTAGAGIGGLTFGAALTRAAGSTAEFDLGGTITLTGAATNNSVLSSGGLAFATANGTDWATLSGSTVAALGSYQTSTDATTWVAANNVSLSSDPLAALGDTAINTLKLSGSSAINVNMVNTLTLGAGGILVTGNGTNSISGGTLKGAGGTTKELVVIQNDTANAFTIGSVIADNGAATHLPKVGSGRST
jgi:fibronectin-binding autotransporter adhesin